MRLTNEELAVIWENINRYVYEKPFDYSYVFVEIMGNYSSVFYDDSDGTNGLYFSNTCSCHDGKVIYMIVRITYKNEDALRKLTKPRSFDEIEELINNDLLNIEFLISLNRNGNWLEIDVDKGIIHWE